MVRLFRFLRPYWKLALLAPIMMLIEVLADLLVPSLLAKIVDQGIGGGDLVLIRDTGLRMMGVVFIGLVGGFGCTIFASGASQNFGADVRRSVFRKVQSFSYENLDRFPTASLVTRLTNDVQQVSMFVLMALRIMVRAPLLAVGGTIMAIRINPQLAGILLVVIPLLALGVCFVMLKGFPLFSQVQKKLDGVNSVMRENLAGVRLIKAFVRREYEETRFGEKNAEFRDVNIKAARVMALAMPLIMLLMNFSIIAVIWWGGIQIDQGNMLVGQILAFINYMTQILFSLMMVAFIFVMVTRAKVSADRINEVLDTEVDIQNPPHACALPVNWGAVTFEHVSFRYANAKGAPALKDVSFSVRPGETIGILGGTGSGKSTLVSLIPRLYDVTEGTIQIDGRDIRTMGLKTLRKAIGLVLQESTLFSGTIAENLRWGKSDATKEELITACKVAEAHDFIEAFPLGYDTLIGQKGVNLSGGQKQRISIARAIVSEPAVLILDDSTSAVDLGTEARIQRALGALRNQLTVVLIAQRINSVRDADKILVLDDGKLVAAGTHEELLANNEIYQEIYHSQGCQEVA